MSEVDTIKSLVTLRDVARSEMGYPAKTAAKNYDLYQCPFHNEAHGYSLAVYDTHAQCFGRCGQTWDVFAFLQRLHGIGFNEAKKHLVERYIGNGVVTSDMPPRPRPAPRPVEQSQPPSDEWQLSAARVIDYAQNILWGKDGGKAMTYLRSQRGLNGVVIQHAQLGYIPGGPGSWVKLEGLSVPCGILIPWAVNDIIWGLKVRRAAGDPKYMQVSGGNIKGGLYWAGEIEPGKPLVIDEGEFNALAMWQAMISKPDTCALVVAIGSTGNAALNLRWYPAIAAAPRVYARMDAGSGDRAAQVLGSLSAAVRKLGMESVDKMLLATDNGNDCLPHESRVKDPNEALLKWGEQQLAEWIAWEVKS
jgi:hypothetical protein